ncbi:MAG: Gfo/Idh/MocA family oxidoreductase [Chloroflexi bacterium]|nr:Gfo/Idh/MocA family oxidoreductase [Chloroflexota bacterium]
MKIGVIGVGSMGRNHARIYAELPGVDLVGVADIDFALAREAAERFHTVPFNSYEELLGQGLDAASIVVPTSMHKEVALAAVRRHTSVLVEKPLADAVPAAREIIQSARENNVRLMVGHVERFNPVVSVLKKQVRGDQISLIEITRIGPFPPRIRDVGILIDLATHDIDLIRHLTGSEFNQMYGLTSQNVAEHEDTAVLVFEMANGSLARITTNWLTPFKVRELTVATKDKFIKASLTDQKVTEYSKYGENDSYLVKEVRVPFGEPLKLELEAFVNSVRDGTTPPVTGEDGLKVLEVLSQDFHDLGRGGELHKMSPKQISFVGV